MVLHHYAIVIDNWNEKSPEQVELIMDMRFVVIPTVHEITHKSVSAKLFITLQLFRRYDKEL